MSFSTTKSAAAKAMFGVKFQFGIAFHDVEIKDEDGKTLFFQEAVGAPDFWSERAVKIAASKYLYGDAHKGPDPAAGGREPSIFDLHNRVARFVAERGLKFGVFDEDIEATDFLDELRGITLGQYAAFNSPVWFNAGLDQYGLVGNDRAYAWERDFMGIGEIEEIRDTVYYPQCSACFIQSVDDNMESLMALARNEAMLFKHGSGTGTDFSTIRSRKERLSNGGKPSGPISFMKIFDRVASVVKSGGKTRRAAKMQTLNAWHPDIMEFIRVKGAEERKAKALIAMGWDSNFNGEAYDTVAFQNANFSVRVDADFMTALRESKPVDDRRTWPLRPITNMVAPIEWVDAEELWRAIAEETHACGDPGLQFAHTINEWHTCPRGINGKPTPINSSNPCSEYLFIDDSACNLASINLLRFQDEEGNFDVGKLKACVRIMITAMEILVDASSYPTRQIAQNSHDFRPLGLGFANLGGLLQANAIAYDSSEGRAIAGLLASIICGEAYAASAALAAKLGPFPGFQTNRESMLRVIAKHRQANRQLVDELKFVCPGHDETARRLIRQIGELSVEASLSWKAAGVYGTAHGFRNAQATVIAPTGTIAFMMDCDTTGIEPNVSLRAWKTLAGGGGMWVVNSLVPRALELMGYQPYSQVAILKYLDQHGTLEGCHRLFPPDLPVFDCAIAPPGFERVLRPEAHLKMMAAVQPFVSGAISKTVNCPSDTTVERISDIYLRAEELGLKCVAIYRDNSKSSQPMNARGGESADEADEVCAKCGSINVVPAGTCGVCTECGEPTGGCG